MTDDTICIDILQTAGFEVSEDGTRLLFDIQRYNQLEAVYTQLLIFEQQQEEEIKSAESEVKRVFFFVCNKLSNKFKQTN